MKKPTTIKEALEGKISKEKIALVPSSFDVVGNILIFVEFPDELKAEEKIIGNTILELYHNIKTVAKKTGMYAGKYRTPKLKIIAGKRTKETTHKENSAILKLHVEKVYFSARLATERKRIAEQVQPGENILVMFSGCGPYVFVLAKNTKAKRILGVEINPSAHKYALENMQLNKTKNVEIFLGDAKIVVPGLAKKTKFDRILMPLPKSAEDFLDTALKAIKHNGTIHFYDFLKEEDIPQAAIKKIDAACKAAKRKYEILKCVRCGQFSPSTSRVCIDFIVH